MTTGGSPAIEEEKSIDVDEDPEVEGLKVEQAGVEIGVDLEVNEVEISKKEGTKRGKKRRKKKKKKKSKKVKDLTEATRDTHDGADELEAAIKDSTQVEGLEEVPLHVNGEDKDLVHQEDTFYSSPPYEPYIPNWAPSLDDVSASPPLWNRSSQSLALTEYEFEENTTTSLDGLQTEIYKLQQTSPDNLYFVSSSSTDQESSAVVMPPIAEKSIQFTQYTTHANRQLQRKYSEDIRGMLLEGYTFSVQDQLYIKLSCSTLD